MTREKLSEVLEHHKKWLCGDGEGLLANLSGADLSRADLSGADLRWADLRWANLRGANLSGDDLSEADLSGADLRWADLRWANLSGANLSGADLSGADLSGANLSGADLSRANLSGADLRWADLRGSDLSGADLRGADLRDVEGLEEITLKCHFPITCPEIGAFIGWKKARSSLIVKLQITESAKRSSAFGRKCRCSEAVVLAIENMDGTPSDKTEVLSKYDKKFVYRVGETVSVPDFDDDRKNECAPGIHFFITRQEAVDY